MTSDRTYRLLFCGQTPWNHVLGHGQPKQNQDFKAILTAKMVRVAGDKRVWTVQLEPKLVSF